MEHSFFGLGGQTPARPMNRVELATHSSAKGDQTANPSQKAASTTCVQNRCLRSGLLRAPELTILEFERDFWLIRSRLKGPIQKHRRLFFGTPPGGNARFAFASRRRPRTDASSFGRACTGAGILWPAHSGSRIVDERQADADPAAAARLVSTLRSGRLEPAGVMSAPSWSRVFQFAQISRPRRHCLIGEVLAPPRRVRQRAGRPVNR